jgi:hypothetical protein
MWVTGARYRKSYDDAGLIAPGLQQLKAFYSHNNQRGKDLTRATLGIWRKGPREPISAPLVFQRVLRHGTSRGYANTYKTAVMVRVPRSKSGLPTGMDLAVCKEAASWNFKINVTLSEHSTSIAEQ